MESGNICGLKTYLAKNWNSDTGLRLQLYATEEGLVPFEAFYSWSAPITLN